MTCATCTGRELLGTTAHYGWCSVVGGSGIRPGSFQHMQAEIRRRADEQAAQLAAAYEEQLRREAEERAKRETNNGWVKFDGHERSYGHLVSVDSRRQCDDLDLTDRVEHRQRYQRDSTPVAQGDRPGKELPQEIRDLIAPLLGEQGFRYSKSNARGRGKPRVFAPDGRQYTLPNTPSDWRALANLRADLRKLGAAV